MIALFSALISAFASWVPDVFKIFQDKRDKQHELDLLDRQMERDKARSSYRLAEIDAKADIAEMYALSSRVPDTTVTWVNGFNAMVRPTLALSFFLLYAAMKAAVVWALIHANAPLIEISPGDVSSTLPWQRMATVMINPVLWTIEDQAIFSSVIGFYFGGRLMQNVRRGK